MNYAILSEVIGKPWQIEISHFAQLRPIFNGLLNGLHIDPTPEPQQNVHYAFGQASKASISMAEVGSQSGSTERFVHVLPIRGIMTKHDQDCGPRGMRTIGQRLLNADKMTDIAGHLIIAESPGGASQAAPELNDAIVACSKPVLVLTDGIFASAAVNGARNADEIWASRETDIIGSIGTMFSYSGRKSISEENQFGEIEITVYADASFEKNLEVREAIDNFNFKPLKENLLNPHNEEFIQNVKAAFPNVEDKHLHGATFQAKDVIDVFINGVCSFDDAVNRVFELAEERNQEGGTPPAQLNQDNKISFEMKYPKLTAALIAASIIAKGSEMEFENDGRRTFTEEEMQSLENALAANNSEELAQQLSDANTTIGQRDTRIKELETQVENLENGDGAESKKDSSQSDGGESSESSMEMLSKEDIELFNKVKRS